MRVNSGPESVSISRSIRAALRSRSTPRAHRADPTPRPVSARRAGHEWLAREETLDAAHAPVRAAVLGEQRRDAGHAGRLRLAADRAQPLESGVVVGGRDRGDGVKPGDPGRARDLRVGRDVEPLAEERLVERVLEGPQASLAVRPEARREDQCRARLVPRQMDLDPAPRVRGGRRSASSRCGDGRPGPRGAPSAPAGARTAATRPRAGRCPRPPRRRATPCTSTGRRRRSRSGSVHAAEVLRPGCPVRAPPTGDSRMPGRGRRSGRRVRTASAPRFGTPSVRSSGASTSPRRAGSPTSSASAASRRSSFAGFTTSGPRATGRRPGSRSGRSDSSSGHASGSRRSRTPRRSSTSSPGT